MSANHQVRERGTVLLFVLIASLLLFGYAGSLVVLSTTSLKDVQAATGQRVAQYLAEGGLEAAKTELQDQYDADGDGLGTLSVDTEQGSYTVEATNVSGGLFQLTSTATSTDGSVVTVRALVQIVFGSRFPRGAIGFIGDPDHVKLHFKKEANILIDGGIEAAIAFSDLAMYEEVAEDLAKAIKSNHLPAESLDGELTMIYSLKNLDVELPIVHDDREGGLTVTDLTDLYDTFAATAEERLQHVTTTLGEFDGDDEAENKLIFGTEDSPAIVHITGKVDLHKGDVLSGYGTLIISNEFKLHHDTVFDWVGDVFVYGAKDKKSKVESDGQLNLTGNLVLLSSIHDKSEFKVKDDGSATIDGSLFVGSHSDDENAEEVKMEIKGDLTVNGLVTAVGSKVDIKFDNDSTTKINGMFQAGIVEGNSRLEIDFEGDLEIHKDIESLAAGANTLATLDPTIEGPLVGEVIEFDVQTRVWSREYLPHGSP